MNIRKPIVIAISAVSGGGKTTVTNQLNKILPKSKSLFFDDYDFDGPNDICHWVERGGDYNEWVLTPLINDLCCLLSEDSRLLDWVLLDYPFAYIHNEVREYIDFAIFIDTPLDIAMARRLVRDFKEASIKEVQVDLNNYLSRGRNAYLEMLNKIKPTCDVIIDGSIPVEDIVKQINKRILEDFYWKTV